MKNNTENCIAREAPMQIFSLVYYTVKIANSRIRAGATGRGGGGGRDLTDKGPLFNFCFNVSLKGRISVILRMLSETVEKVKPKLNTLGYEILRGPFKK